MSNRRLARTYTLQAEFNGEGVLTADPYPLFPRAFLWAHLDDGIMETVTTNWGNEGIFMEGVGPSLVGRSVAGLGPLQRVRLGGALYFDTNGNLAYDPSALEAQIAVLGNQQVIDEAVTAALQAKLAADETTNSTAIATLQTALATANAQILALQQQVSFINSSAIFKPTINTVLAGAGGLTAGLRVGSFLLGAQLSGGGNLAAAVQIAGAATLWTGTANLSGSGSLIANLVPAVSSWDTTHSSSGTIFSNNNNTITNSSGSSYSTTLGAKSNSSGKCYFEVHFDVQATTAVGIGNSAGVANSSYAWSAGSNYPGSDRASWGIGVYGSGNNTEFWNAVGRGFFGAAHSGDIAMIAVDFSAGNIWMGINGAWSPGANPGTNTAPDYTFTLGTQLWPVSMAIKNPNQTTTTLNTGGSAFVYGLPSGYSAWG